MVSFFSCQLANRGVIRLGGADRRVFLQGLISNDVELCRPERAIYAALLTPQGKFLHDLFVIDAGDEFLIDCEAARAEDLLRRLAAYKLRAKVTLADARGDFESWAIWDSTTSSLSFPRKRESIASDSERESLSARGRAPMDPRMRGDDIVFYVDSRLPELGTRAIVKKGTVPGGFEPADFAAYDRHRLAFGVADGSRDMIVEKSTLAEGNFDFLNGISWSKGCYVGQELTARMRYRGLVKKRLFPVRIEGSAPDFGAAITFNDEDIGDMRSACGNRGLTLLNIEKAETAIKENAALICGGSKLTVSRPGWMDLAKDA